MTIMWYIGIGQASKRSISWKEFLPLLGSTRLPNFWTHPFTGALQWRGAGVALLAALDTFGAGGLGRWVSGGRMRWWWVGDLRVEETRKVDSQQFQFELYCRRKFMACEFHIVGSWLLKIQLWIAWFHSPGTVVQELFAYFCMLFGQSSNHRII